MPTCPGCGREYSAEELVRHEHETLIVVHCPDCHAAFGRYRRR